MKRPFLAMVSSLLILGLSVPVLAAETGPTDTAQPEMAAVMPPTELRAIADRLGTTTAEVTASQRATRDVNKLEQLLSASDEFAGIWASFEPAFTLNIGYVNTSDSLVRIVEAAQIGRYNISYVKRDASKREIAAFMNRVAEIGSDASWNVIDGSVEIRGASNAERESLIRSISRKIRVVESPLPKMKPVHQGGLRASRTPPANCTTGFAAYRNGVPVITTAAHCGNGTWSVTETDGSTQSLPTQSGSSCTQTSDMQVHTVTSGTFTRTVRNNAVSSFANPYAGLGAWRYGATTNNWQYGTFTGPGTAAYGNVGNCQVTLVHQLWVLNTPSLVGDSGGPAITWVGYWLGVGTTATGDSTGAGMHGAYDQFQALGLS